MQTSNHIQQHPIPSFHPTPRFRHTQRSHHTPCAHQTSSSRRRHLPHNYTHHQRHSPPNVHRVATFPAGRMEPWLSIGEISRQNSRPRRRFYGGGVQERESRQHINHPRIKKLPVTVTRKAGGGKRVLSRLVERRMRRALRGRSVVLVGESRSEY